MVPSCQILGPQKHIAGQIWNEIPQRLGFAEGTGGKYNHILTRFGNLPTRALRENKTHRKRMDGGSLFDSSPWHQVLCGSEHLTRQGVKRVAGEGPSGVLCGGGQEHTGKSWNEFRLHLPRSAKLRMSEQN